jgi:hypothetical protein
MALLLKFEPRIARFVVVALCGGSLFVTGTSRQKEDWGGVAERVGSDSILICQPGEVAAMRHVTRGGNRIFLNRWDGKAEMAGEPWQQAYYEIMSDRRRMDEALKLGQRAYPSLYPVWPVRSGEVLSPGPVSLGRAVMLCQPDKPDWRTRYIAD